MKWSALEDGVSDAPHTCKPILGEAVLTMAGRAQWEWALLVGAQRTKKRSFIAVPCLRRLSWCFWVAF